MLSARTKYETANGSRLLQSLCKHFAHKVSVDYDDTKGHADMPMGPVTLKADDSGLEIQVTGEDTKSLTQGRYVVEDHLLRFAFRENPQPLIWKV